MTRRLTNDLFIATFLCVTMGSAACTASAPLRTPAANSYAVPLIQRFEQPPAGEPQTIERIVRHAREQLARGYCEENPDNPCCAGNVAETIRCTAPGTGSTQPARRDAHQKHHGCVVGEFEALRSDSPELAQGVFATGSHYPAVVRFSNAHPTTQPDRVGDGRGMAIKLMGVPGAKILSRLADEPKWRGEERATQDLLLINNPRFFIADVETYEDFSAAKDSDSTAQFLRFFLLHPRALWIIREIQSNAVYSPLEISYHSMTPSLLGTPDRGVAVKYHVDPISCKDGSAVEQSERPTKADNYLRDAMRERLDPQGAAGPVCFAISVAVARSARASIEDATNEWTVKDSQIVRLARLTIPPQSFDEPEQRRLCEDLSFTPWHTLPKHQPIGGLNRLRLSVYRAISELRHQLNRALTFEPRGSSWDEVSRSARRTSQTDENSAENRKGE